MIFGMLIERFTGLREKFDGGGGGGGKVSNCGGGGGGLGCDEASGFRL